MLLPKPTFGLSMLQPFPKYPHIYSLSTCYPLACSDSRLRKVYKELAREMRAIPVKVFKNDNREELVAICGGTYDILHANHMAYLSTIALIVGGRRSVKIILDSDNYCLFRK
ncbi:MAG: hypothetical protein ABIE03_06875 [Patescibacteria group bacterium]